MSASSGGSVAGPVGGSTPSAATAAATERLIQLLFVLARSGGRVPAAELMRVARYGAADHEGRRRQLGRDIDQLRQAGWDIRNEAGAGSDALYRLVTGDLRIRVRFDPAEQAELQRIARVAGLPRLADEAGAGRDDDSAHVVSVPPDPGRLDLALHAVESRCLLRFGYKGTPRTVHPVSVHPRVTGWYLRGREEAVGGVLGEPKLFRLDRMGDVEVDDPGSARAPEPEDVRVSIDPITWHMDAPLTAVVAAPPEHVPHVADLLGRPSVTRPEVDGTVLMEIPVTHRGAFRSRLYELGVRVRLVGPPELREEVRAELSAVVEGRP